MSSLPEQGSEERICAEALRGFAERGVAATSIRDVAAAAGVSAGIVQYHFPSKEDLRRAVHEQVLALVSEAFAEPPAGTSAEEIQRELGDRVTRLAGERPEALRYVARLAADGDPLVSELFDTFVTIADGQWTRLADEEKLRPDADLRWAGLQTVVLVLGSFLLEAAIGRRLGTSWREPRELQRWNEANSALFREGLYRRERSVG